MKTRGELLRAHYIGVLKRATTWVAFMSLAASLFTTLFGSLPALATAGILEPRVSTLSNSAGAATGVTATFLTTAGTTATIDSVQFYLCSSPLSSVACSSPAGATMAATTAGSELESGSAIGHAYGTPAYTTTTSVCFSNATGNLFTAGTDSLQFPVQNITLPTAPNAEFYFREQTYTSNNCGTGATDFGAMAESTTQMLSVTANVQEALTFCVGIVNTATCGSIGGAGVALNTGGSTANPLSATATSYGNAYMDASTNGQGGYAIAYNATTFTDTTANTITSASGTGTVMTAGSDGTEMFGFNVAANPTNFGTLSAGPYGGAPSPNAATSVTGGYGTADEIAYTAGSASPLLTMTGTNSTTNDEYTLTYGCNIATTTKAGSYTATQTFIATATF